MKLEVETSKIFDNFEKWEAYLELCNQKQGIIKYWNSNFGLQIKNHFSEEKLLNLLEEKYPEWSFWSNGNDDFRWHLKDFDENSLLICLEIEAGWKFSLWNNNGNFEDYKIRKELEKNSKLINLFGNNRIITPNTNHNYKIVEHGNFEFGTKFNTHISNDILSWYAGNKSEEFLNQIIKKINNFRTPEITKILREINTVSKK